MAMMQPFSKYSGCGNDFIFIDNREGTFPIEDISFIPELCCRDTGIGADGVVFMECSSGFADVKMRIFNKDGSEAAMCGNALRCVLPFISKSSLFVISSLSVETRDSVHKLSCSAEGVAAAISSPRDVRWSLQVDVDFPMAATGQMRVDYMNTGVPHVVVFVEDIAFPGFLQTARQLRHHKSFAPEGVNVNVVAVLSDDTLAIRTFERGVEGETDACGTGATAAALAAHHRGLCKSPITLIPRSGEKLKVCFLYEEDHYNDVVLSGKVAHVFDGLFCPESYRWQIAPYVSSDEILEKITKE
jgi:diaminopimelate epimerase